MTPEALREVNNRVAGLATEAKDQVKCGDQHAKYQKAVIVRQPQIQPLLV